MEQICFKTNRVEPRLTLLNWLKIARQQLDETEEIDKQISRLERESKYYEYQNKKLKEKIDINVDDYFIDDLKQKITDERKEVLDNILANHDKALEYLKNSGTYIDEETIAYGKDDIFNTCSRKEMSEFLDIFAVYIHRFATNLEEHEFYNDEIDDWYFEKYLKNKPYEFDRYHFPCEEFILKYKDTYIRYSEISGQGTICGFSIMSDNFKNVYGLTNEQVMKRVYDLDKFIEEKQNV